MTYYEIIALIFSVIALLLAFISYMIYLILSKYSILPAIKDSAFKHIFTFLSSIPLICAALDVLYLIEGIIGMAAVLILGAILDNGRQKWVPSINTTSLSSKIVSYFKISLQIDRQIKGKIGKLIIISIIWNLFFYKTCVCFYNAGLFFYTDQFGLGINTYVTRFIQL